MQGHGYTRSETRSEHVSERAETVIKAAEKLLSLVDSWQTGVYPDSAEIRKTPLPTVLDAILLHP
jgi:hypothetical protein